MRRSLRSRRRRGRDIDIPSKSLSQHYEEAQREKAKANRDNIIPVLAELLRNPTPKKDDNVGTYADLVQFEEQIKICVANPGQFMASWRLLAMVAGEPNLYDFVNQKRWTEFELKTHRYSETEFEILAQFQRRIREENSHQKDESATPSKSIVNNKVPQLQQQKHDTPSNRPIAVINKVPSTIRGSSSGSIASTTLSIAAAPNVASITYTPVPKPPPTAITPLQIAPTTPTTQRSVAGSGGFGSRCAVGIPVVQTATVTATATPSAAAATAGAPTDVTTGSSGATTPLPIASTAAAAPVVVPTPCASPLAPSSNYGGGFGTREMGPPKQAVPIMHRTTVTRGGGFGGGGQKR